MHLKFMTYFIHKILTNMLRAANEAIFRVMLLLQEYKGNICG
jgi:hypothetical protein